MSTLEVATRWGVLPARNDYLTHSSGSSKLAVLFPGRGYPLDAPVMWYSARAAFSAGCDVLGVEYGYQANRTELDIEELDYLVDEVAGILNQVMTDQYSSVVFMGKSLGTIVQTKVLQKVSFSVRNHVFVTPLRPVIPAIRQAENALVVAGDSDSAFTASDMAQVADLSNVKTSVIAGADHALETKDYSTSIDILKQVATLCEGFCRESL